ncbi:MAG TPA: alpha/beta hydrolase [Chloroflexia bacterium]|nr:alpha/beta hydrolase [Chloroflexia bacterium]
MSETLQARYGRAKVNDVELAWIEWGEHEAPDEKTIVAVHGITANLHTWDSIAPALTGSGYRLIGYDLRGRGDSAKPASGYNPGVHAADLKSLLDYFGLQRPNLFGHSLGAVICLNFAALYPDRLRSLVLIDHGMDTAPDARETISSTISRLSKSFDSLDDYLNLFRNSPVFARWTPQVEGYFSYDAVQREDGRFVPKVPASVFEEEFASLFVPDYLPSRLYDKIKVPTLILKAGVGTLDGGKRGFILSQEGAEKAVSSIQNARLVSVEGVNHYTIMLDPTPVVAQEILTFLQGVRA